MPTLEWILLFIVNGIPSQMPPMMAEECILHMLAKPAIEQPFCYNINTRERMQRPEDCHEVRFRYCQV
jgi:hypothetical protein